MNTAALISAKRDGHRLSRAQIHYLVNGYTRGRIPDYQMSAFLMAALLNDLDREEAFWLTEAMLHSGESIPFPARLHPVFDKHSTGGVGDKISLTLGPLLASMGVNIAMLSGAGLGHTGGTLDKLAAIPNLNPFWTKNQIHSRLAKVGLAISGQTGKIAPADKKIYALRDLTGTVESIPLITASILSKKLAMETDGIVFDIKVGSGAFMKTAARARALARMLHYVCRKFNRPASCLLTDMSEPLGTHVGNYLEIMEAIAFLQTGQPADIREITYRLAIEVFRLKSRNVWSRELIRRFDEAIFSGRALGKFRELVKISGGETKIFDKPQAYFRPACRGAFKAQRSGFIHSFDTALIGLAAVELGAGRKRLEDRIDPMAGLILRHKIGSAVNRGETIFQLFGSSRSHIKSAGEILADAVKIAQEKIAPPRKIITLIKA